MERRRGAWARWFRRGVLVERALVARHQPAASAQRAYGDGEVLRLEKQAGQERLIPSLVGIFARGLCCRGQLSMFEYELLPLG